MSAKLSRKQHFIHIAQPISCELQTAVCLMLECVLLIIFLLEI